MNRLYKHEPTLHFLYKSKPALQKAVASRSNDELIKTSCEIWLNALSVPLTRCAKTKLPKHKKVFERFQIAELV